MSHSVVEILLFTIDSTNNCGSIISLDPSSRMWDWLHCHVVQIAGESHYCESGHLNTLLKMKQWKHWWRKTCIQACLEWGVMLRRTTQESDDLIRESLSNYMKWDWVRWRNQRHCLPSLYIPGSFGLKLLIYMASSSFRQRRKLNLNVPICEVPWPTKNVDKRESYHPLVALWLRLPGGKKIPNESISQSQSELPNNCTAFCKLIYCLKKHNSRYCLMISFHIGKLHCCALYPILFHMGLDRSVLKSCKLNFTFNSCFLLHLQMP